MADTAEKEDYSYEEFQFLIGKVQLYWLLAWLLTTRYWVSIPHR